MEKAEDSVFSEKEAGDGLHDLPSGAKKMYRRPSLHVQSVQNVPAQRDPWENATARLVGLIGYFKTLGDLDVVRSLELIIVDLAVMTVDARRYRALRDRSSPTWRSLILKWNMHPIEVDLTIDKEFQLR